MKPGDLIKLSTKFRICLLYDKAAFDQAVKWIDNITVVDFQKLHFVEYNCSESPVMYLGQADLKIDRFVSGSNAATSFKRRSVLDMVLHQGTVWYHMSSDGKWPLEEIFEVWNGHET